MGLFSFFRKNKQEPASGTSEFYSRAEEESSAVRGRGKRKQSNKANEPVDPVLPEKKRARRRLVGAVALVLAAVIGLPMILDSEPKPLADDIAIQIPSKDKPFQPNASRPMTPPAPAIGGKVSASAGLDKNEEVIEPSSIGATPAKENPNPPPTANTSSKPEQAQPSGKPEFKAITQTQPAAKADDAARARAILEGKPDGKAEKAKAAEIKPNKFIVQVAALASQGKVNELQGKLKSAGIKSYTQKVATQTGERIRIRVGPFASKEEADKMRAKLGKIGLNGTLVPA